MIQCTAEQGALGWLVDRLGIPTASELHRIVTDKGELRRPKGQKTGLSEGAETYLSEKIAEWLLGEPIDVSKSQWMQRGSAMEQEGMAWAELEHEVAIERVGFGLTDNRGFGASPDGICRAKNCGYELKCLGPAKHVSVIRGQGAEDYYCQIQGGMYVWELPLWYLVSYHPTIRPKMVRFERDDGFHLNLWRSLKEFGGYFADEKERLLNMGYVPVPPKLPSSALIGTNAPLVATPGDAEFDALVASMGQTAAA